MNPAPAAALSITTTTLPSGKAGTAYKTSIASTGGTSAKTWSVSSGTLPTGLRLVVSTDTRTVTLTGTPTVRSKYTFTTTVRDSAGASASRKYSVTVGR